MNVKIIQVPKRDELPVDGFFSPDGSWLALIDTSSQANLFKVSCDQSGSPYLTEAGFVIPEARCVAFRTDAISQQVVEVAIAAPKEILRFDLLARRPLDSIGIAADCMDYSDWEPYLVVGRANCIELFRLGGTPSSRTKTFLVEQTAVQLKLTRDGVIAIATNTGHAYVQTEMGIQSMLHDPETGEPRDIVAAEVIALGPANQLAIASGKKTFCQQQMQQSLAGLGAKAVQERLGSVCVVEADRVAFFQTHRTYAEFFRFCLNGDILVGARSGFEVWRKKSSLGEPVETWQFESFWHPVTDSKILAVQPIGNEIYVAI